MGGLFVPYNSGNNVGTVYRDNVVYASGTNPTSYVVSGEPASSSENFLGVTLDHNLWFHAGRSNPFHWGANDYTFAQWLALPGSAHGAGDLNTNPGLVDPTSVDVITDKQPASASSAEVDAGTDAGEALDYNFCPRPVDANAAPGDFDMGA